jgi:SAM-dependent methyltransferase
MHMVLLNKFIQQNRAAWDAMTQLHLDPHSSYVPRLQRLLERDFSASDDTPDPLEGIDRKRLLHLQCHIGLDSFLWAHRGAEVVGLDFSAAAIEQARRLEQQLKLGVRFVECDVYQARQVLQGTFDVVLSYYGVLCWLPDLKAWAKTAASLLAAGGLFYLADEHPVARTLKVVDASGLVLPKYNYFGSPVPEEFQGTGTYANPASPAKYLTYEWRYALQDVICALVEAGLQIEYFHEFPFSFYNNFYYHPQQIMEEREGRWYFKDNRVEVPLTFSIGARKPGL